MLRISIENSVYITCNIYGHNEDKVEYFEEILSVVDILDMDHIFIMGQFNMIIDRNLDCINRHTIMIGLTATLSTSVNKVVLLIPSDSIFLKIENISGLGITHH